MTSKDTVISRKRVPMIEDSINTLRYRAINWHETPDFTHDEIYSLMVRPEHLETLNEAVKVCGIIQRHDYYETKVFLPDQPDATPMQIHFAPSLDKLIPDYAKKGFLKGANPHVTERIQEWANRRYLLGKDFAHVKLVFDILNKKCNTITQMAAYFSGLVAILDSHQELKPLANKVREAKLPSELPATTREFRAACQRATQIMATTMLLPSETPKAKPIIFSFSQLGSAKFDFAGDARRAVL